MSKRVPFVVLAAAVSAWMIGSPARAEDGGSAVKQTPFVAIVMSHFSQWDKDGNGELASSELDAAVADPANTGDAGAAAGSLRMVSRNTAKLGPVPPLTKAYFEAYNAKAIKWVGHETAASAENATVDPGTERAAGEVKAADAEKSPGLNWDRYFLAGKARIAKDGIAKNTNNKDWPAHVSLASMKQGPLGDCFFIATVGSMVMRSPDRLQEIIHPLDDGEFRITFPNVDSFVIKPVTDGYRAMSSTTADEGAWMAVLEQAYGKLRSQTRGGSLDVDGTDILRVGGDSRYVIMQLTGHAVKRISFPPTAEAREAKSKLILADLRKSLVENLKAGRLITAGVNPSTSPTTKPATPTTRPAVDGDGDAKPKDAIDAKPGTPPVVPPGIVKKHVYAIVGYDEATDTLELWNPHSNTFTPKGADGLKNGYTTQGGKFKLPLAEAYAFYTSFSFETAEPVKTKDATPTAGQAPAPTR